MECQFISTPIGRIARSIADLQNPSVEGIFSADHIVLGWHLGGKGTVGADRQIRHGSVRVGYLPFADDAFGGKHGGNCDNSCDNEGDKER